MVVYLHMFSQNILVCNHIQSHLSSECMCLRFCKVMNGKNLTLENNILKNHMKLNLVARGPISLI